MYQEWLLNTINQSSRLPEGEEVWSKDVKRYQAAITHKGTCLAFTGGTFSEINIRITESLSQLFVLKRKS